MRTSLTPHLRLIAGLGFAGCMVMLAGLVSLYAPFGIDWHLTFRPAALAVWAGHSPYTVEIFGLAPWGILPFLPLALLPEAVGRGIWFGVSLMAFAAAVYRLRARHIALAAFLLSPPVLNDLLNANVNALVLLGFTLPPVWGLFLVSIKPQVGVGLMVFWLAEAWRNGGWRAVLRTFGPFTAVGVASFILFGWWPAHALHVFQSSQSWNASLWPASLPVGLVLLVAALRRREPHYAMAASPCLSPYVLFHAWSGALVALAAQPIEMLVAVVGLWGLVLLRVVGPR